MTNLNILLTLFRTLCLQVTAAIVTCGGLCPGLNDVIQNIVWTLDDYGVKDILGIRYGLSGFTDREWRPMQLNRQAPVQCGRLVRCQEPLEACQRLSLLPAGEAPQMEEWSRQAPVLCSVLLADKGLLWAASAEPAPVACWSAAKQMTMLANGPMAALASLPTTWAPCSTGPAQHRDRGPSGQGCMGAADAQP